MNTTLTATGSHSVLTRGWVSPPNIRGTFDIALSCGLTIFLCAWSSICVSVPSPNHGKWDLFRDKWHMFCLGLLGPEFIFMMALGQYMEARASENAFKRSGYQNWTIKHSFFADMGGVFLQPRDWKSFPVDAKQIHYLIERGYLTCLPINEAMIDDKNKADGLARFITTFQMLWFTLNTIARPVQRLDVSTMEITTLGFIFCTLGINFCWRYKPMDVEIPITLNTDFTIQQILLDAGESVSQRYKLTPLDFIGRKEWLVDWLWTFYVNLLRKMRLVHQRPRVRPAQKFSSFIFPELTPKTALVPLLVTIVYSAIFMICWNFEFPSNLEHILWRLATGMTIGVTLVGGGYEIFSIARRGRETSNNPSKKEDNTISGSTLSEMDCGLTLELNGCKISRGNSAVGIPLRSILITTPLCALYTISRAYILIEDIVGLRALPPSSFQTVEWTQFLPHF
ncbi:hypothetical protein M501DRAFT_925039 [Patellaria atrata CBS 101060]|uniref:Uncharacterized protein n=1 Tax=Patellaria atrata CBS 101060 TaxID=1346257 RepID=A0A9P4SKH4_9PEZI|nr:hypothetical protein M501DRAFT_925039 [Patellaria atrata CBS 101060]